MSLRPTATELMMFVDGELDGARADEIAFILLGDRELQARVEALRLADSMFAEHVSAREGFADGIADAVMAKIATEEALPLRDALPEPGVVRLAERRKVRGPVSAKAAAWATLAFAAAAILWMRSPSVPTLLSGRGPSAERESVMSMMGSAAVEIVDFGAHVGTVFYVPADEAKTTTVVWLSDDDGAIGGDGP